MTSIILKWKKFGATRTITAKFSHQGRKTLVREVMKNPKLQRACVETEDTPRRITMTKALHQSGLYGRVARKKPLLIDETKIVLFGFNSDFMSGGNSYRSLPAQSLPSGEAWCWQHHAVGVLFSSRDRETGHG